MKIEPGMRAFVTGASRGIGASLARALAERGVTVGLAARSTGELEQLAATLPGKHEVIACDVASSESVRDAIAEFVERTGGLELLVANAGITHYGPFREQSLEEMLEMSEVNWQGTLRTVHYGLPYMLDRARGQVTDKADTPIGGGCYNCHQIDKKEISYGTIGPSLWNYGKLRGNSQELVVYTWNRINNSKAYNACSNMPRFAHFKLLNEQQIQDLMALLLDPASPVNQ